VSYFTLSSMVLVAEIHAVFSSSDHVMEKRRKEQEVAHNEARIFELQRLIADTMGDEQLQREENRHRRFSERMGGRIVALRRLRERYNELELEQATSRR